MTKAKFSFIDLFAGIGGFRLALEDVGGECVGFSEIAADAIKYYCTNYQETPSANLGDITKLNKLPVHDLLTGGVPCQSWSIAGKNLGFDDSRGQLWNDALFLLNASRPKAFLFENVKGLADPRNQDALRFILDKIREAGYYANYYVLNSFDYGVPQNRIRIYIIGFKEKVYFDRFQLPEINPCSQSLEEVFGYVKTENVRPGIKGKQSISVNNEGMNDYFLFNDLRSGDTTIHSWDLANTTDKEKEICRLLLQNRRKKIYGPLDGNPLSLHHFKSLMPQITQDDITELVSKGIFKEIRYRFNITGVEIPFKSIFSKYNVTNITIDKLKNDRDFKIAKINVTKLLDELCNEGLALCTEIRYDFKNSKISTGLNGINRIFLPTSRLYPTLVASDTNDYIAENVINGKTPLEYKQNFLKDIYLPGRFRQITKKEACAIQGFPLDFILPESRARWMKLLGNSVAVKLIKQLAYAIVSTGVFDENDYTTVSETIAKACQLSLFDD